MTIDHHYHLGPGYAKPKCTCTLKMFGLFFFWFQQEQKMVASVIFRKLLGQLSNQKSCLMCQMFVKIYSFVRKINGRGQ